MSLWDIGRLVAIACGAGMSFGFLTSDHHAQWADWAAMLTGIASGAASLPFSNRLVQRVETERALVFLYWAALPATLLLVLGVAVAVRSALPTI